MPLDQFSKDILKNVVRELAHIVGRLDQLVGIANRPRQNDDQGEGPKGAPTQKDYATIGKMLLLKNASTSIQQKEDPKTKWYKTLQGWKVLFELIAIPFAVLYAIVTFFQWQDARENFKIGQRPWVGLVMPDNRGQTFLDPIEPGQPVKWHYNFKNYGNSPALRARGHARIFLANASPDWNSLGNEIENLPLIEGTENPLFNGGEGPDAGVSNMTLDQSAVDQINSYKLLIVLGGVVEYFDGANVRHVTTWCVVYIPPTPDKFPGWHTCPINPVVT